MKIFINLVQERFYEQMLALSQSRCFELHYQIETWQFNASSLLFTGLNLNTTIQKKKRQTKSRFMDDALRTRAIKNM